MKNRAIDAWNIEGYYDNKRGLAEEFRRDPQDIAYLVDAEPDLRAMSTDASWMLLFQQERLNEEEQLRWLKDPSWQRMPLSVEVFLRSYDDVSATVQRRYQQFPSGVRVAGVESNGLRQARIRWMLADPLVDSFGLEHRLLEAVLSVDAFGIHRFEVDLNPSETFTLLLGSGTVDAPGLLAAAAALRRRIDTQHQRAAADAERHRTVYRSSALADPRQGTLGALQAKLHRCANKTSLSAHELSAVESFAVAEVICRRTKTPEAAAARVGGEVELPDTLEWPAGESGPLCFVAEVDLDRLPELPHRSIEATGRLVLFLGNFDDGDGHPEHYVAIVDPKMSRPRPHPEIDADLEYLAFESPPLFLSASVGIGLPNRFTAAGAALSSDVDPDRYDAIRTKLQPRRPALSMLGYPDAMNGDPQLEVADDDDDMTTVEPWIPLLTLSGFDFDGEFDDLTVNILIHRDDLKSGRFDRTRAHAAWT